MEEACDQVMDGLGDDDLSGLGCLQEARGDIRRVADCSVVHAEVASDAAHDDQPGVESLAHPEVDAAVAFKLGAIRIQSPPNAERRLDRAAGVILVSDRCPKQRHDSIAEELVYRALVPVNLGEHQLEGPSHQHVDDLRVKPLAERGEA